MLFEIEYNKKPLVIEEIRDLLLDEFKAVDRLITKHLHSEIPLIEEISRHIISSGGKRLRPLLLLLVASAFDYKGNDHVALAAVVEFLHTATLLHDDVVDNSTLRRGQQTANIIWGNASSILVGDFLYSRTFEILTNLNNMQVMDILAKTTNAIAEGEVLQLIKRNDPQTDEAHYMQVICNKTARLFQAATEVATLICQRPAIEQEKMASFGLHLGMAFQLIDDALDYAGSSDKLGKNIGDDLAEGKVTLPLIHAIQYSKPDQAEMIKEAIRQGGTTHLDMIVKAIQEASSLEYTFAKAQEQTDLALTYLTFLKDSSYKTGLINLTFFALHRKY